MKRNWLLILLLTLCMQMSAQSGIARFFKKVGTTLDSMAVSGIDRNYIEAPERPWQVIARGNVSQSMLKMNTSGTISDISYSAHPYLRTEPSTYVGLWVGYRGYGLGYTVNVGGDKGGYFTFGATGGSYGVNVRIHTFENDNPYFEIVDNTTPGGGSTGRQKVKLMDPIKVRTVIADGYYMFNGKHFSYAAAYDQSVIQKRSAGSLMVGAMYYYGHINYATDKNAELIYVMRGLGRIKLWQGSVGLGYAYNWVPTRGLLISAMAMPMLTFVNKMKVYAYNTNVPELVEDPNFLNPDLTEEEWDRWWYGNTRITPMTDRSFNSGITVNFDARMSISYNFGRCFVAAYGQFNNFRYNHDQNDGYVNDWFINTSFGVRL